MKAEGGREKCKKSIYITIITSLFFSTSCAFAQLVHIEPSHDGGADIQIYQPYHTLQHFNSPQSRRNTIKVMTYNVFKSF